MKVLGGGVAAGVLVLGAMLAESAAAGPDAPLPYRDLAEAGSGFHGPGRDSPAPTTSSVRLGLIGPARSPEGARLRAGVALAVEDANARGGFRGLPYEVVFRADDGPWGMAAKQVTALAYQDSVWTILGGLEGGDAHVAELIAAKVWIPVVTPTAADMTIDYANVPWVFRCFPSDDRQARLLAGWVKRHGIRSWLGIFEADREGRTGRSRLADAAARADVPLPRELEVQPHLVPTALEEIEVGSFEAIVVWTRARSGTGLVRDLRGRGYTGPILAPATLLSPALLPPPSDLGDLVVAAPYDLRHRGGADGPLGQRYRERTGETADPVALFAYDAASMVIAAIEEAGLNRARIRDVLAGLRHEGLTGTLQFDGLGGSRREPLLMRATPEGWVREGEIREAARDGAEG